MYKVKLKPIYAHHQGPPLSQERVATKASDIEGSGGAVSTSLKWVSPQAPKNTAQRETSEKNRTAADRSTETILWAACQNKSYSSNP